MFSLHLSPHHYTRNFSSEVLLPCPGVEADIQWAIWWLRKKDISCENARLQRNIYCGTEQLAPQTGKRNSHEWFPLGATVMCCCHPHSLLCMNWNAEYIAHPKIPPTPCPQIVFPIQYSLELAPHNTHLFEGHHFWHDKMKAEVHLNRYGQLTNSGTYVEKWRFLFSLILCFFLETMSWYCTWMWPISTLVTKQASYFLTVPSPQPNFTLQFRYYKWKKELHLFSSAGIVC
jgi:hypothetical protein